MSKSHQRVIQLGSSNTASELRLVSNPRLGASINASCDREQLRREISALHRAVFGREVPEKIAQQYVEAHSVAQLSTSVLDRQWLRCVVEQEADLEALELVLRARKPNHVLCQKLKLLIYIAEAFPEYYGDFVNETPQRARALCILAMHGVRMLYKHLKGWCMFQSFA